MSKQPSILTVKKLFALSGNTCALHPCTMPLIDPENGVIIGEVCHIKAREAGGARYDELQTDAERNGFENLVLLCSVHHKVIDTAIDSYPVEHLKEIKHSHEAKHKNGLPPSDEVAEKLLGGINVNGSVIVNSNQQGGQVAHQIINSNFYQQPPPTPVLLSLVIVPALSKVDHQVGFDYYDLKINLCNDGTKTVREFCIIAEIPTKYVENAASHVSHVPSPTPRLTETFRRTQQELSSPAKQFSLPPKATQLVLGLSFVIKSQHYLEGVTEAIKISLYAADDLVTEDDYPIAEMLNTERVQHLLKASDGV